MATDNRSLIELPKLDLESVILKLPLPFLFACCCVSKSLFNLIRKDANFARTHFEISESQLMVHSPSDSRFHLIDLNSDAKPPFAERVEIDTIFNLPLYGFEVTHSCNGLVLLENCNMDVDIHRCMVCNPVTGEYIILPESIAFSRNVRCAFSYCPVTSRFNVFRGYHRVYRFLPDSESSFSDSDSDADSDSESVYSEGDTMGEYLSWGSDSWESLGTLPFCPRTIYSPCYLNNATHWLCGDENVDDLIVLFNFETGQFGVISGPAHMTKTYASSPEKVNLIPLDGFLSIFDNYTTKTSFDVWKMNGYGVWTKAFVIDTTAWGVHRNYYFKPVICRSNWEVVMACEAGYIVFHDLVKKRGRIVFHPALERPSKAIAHIASLIPLEDVIEANNMVVLKVAPRFVQPDLNTRNYVQLSMTYL